MIDLILKPHGAYEYRWERVESGWDEIQSVLGQYANYIPSNDEPALTHGGFGGAIDDIKITILSKSDGPIFIPRALTEAAMNIRVREGDGEWMTYQSMEITQAHDEWCEKFSTIVLVYSR